MADVLLSTALPSNPKLKTSKIESFTFRVSGLFVKIPSFPFPIFLCTLCEHSLISISHFPVYFMWKFPHNSFPIFLYTLCENSLIPISHFPVYSSRKFRHTHVSFSSILYVKIPSCSYLIFLFTWKFLHSHFSFSCIIHVITPSYAFLIFLYTPCQNFFIPISHFSYILYVIFPSQPFLIFLYSPHFWVKIRDVMAFSGKKYLNHRPPSPAADGLCVL